MKKNSILYFNFWSQIKNGTNQTFKRECEHCCKPLITFIYEKLYLKYSCFIWNSLDEFKISNGLSFMECTMFLHEK
jgi:hypothetical protein